MSLDDDISAWTATVRLSDAEADDIFGRIVETPVPEQTPQLHPSWWRGFTADFATRMVTSTRPVRRAALAAVAKSPRGGRLFPRVICHASGQPPDNADHPALDGGPIAGWDELRFEFSVG